MTVHLGSNPVDLEYAYRAAIESSLDVTSSLNECVENSRDYAKEITVTFFGDPIPGKPGIINLTSVEIDDDGCGMDFAVMYEKFRGAYFNSASHDRSDQSGRNGVGVKTNLQYWNEIKVSTTTNGFIPSKSQWQCSGINRDEIEKRYRSISKLKAGDPDTEMRIMTLKASNAELPDAFEKVARDDSWTKVTLLGPRSTIEFNVEDFIKRQSHCFEWLETKGNSLTVGYKNEQGRKVNRVIRPFYEHDKKDTFICHVHGNSKEDMHIHFQDAHGTQQSKVIPADQENVLGPIYLDIKILDRDADSTNPNEFVVSICGANVYDGVKRKSAVSPSIDYFMGKHHFKSSNGFSYRIHGYIQTDDEHLKRALRHNKSVLDEDDKYTKAFISYVVSVFQELNTMYVDSLKMLTDSDAADVLKQIGLEFNTVMSRVSEKTARKRGVKDTDKNPVTLKHKEYHCKSCDLAWRVPLEKTPSFCAEYNINGATGCGSRDIDRNTHETPEKNDFGMKNVNFVWSKNLGGFLPARYEPTENIIRLAEAHPSFITLPNFSAQKAKAHKITVGLEKAFVAVAAYKAQNENRPMDVVYGEILREWFENKGTRDPHKVQCHKEWKERGLAIDQI